MDMRFSAGALVGAALLAVGLLTAGDGHAQETGGSSYPGPYYLGYPDAPVTMDAYEDFQ